MVLREQAREDRHLDKAVRQEVEQDSKLAEAENLCDHQLAINDELNVQLDSLEA